MLNATVLRNIYVRSRLATISFSLASTKLLLMTLRNNKMLFGSFLVFLFCDPFALYGQSTPSIPSGQPTLDEPIPATTSSLPLAPAKASQLNQAVAAHDYKAAEKLLLDEIQLDPH